MMPMYVDIKVGEKLRLSGEGAATITVEAKSGERARLAIEADSSVKIDPPRSSRPAAKGLPMS